MVLLLGCPGCGDDGDPADAASGAATVGDTTNGQGATTNPDPDGTGSNGGDSTGSAASSGAGPSSGAETSDPGTSGQTTSGDTNTNDPGGGSIDVNLDGCAIDFGGTIVVSYNGSLGVASVYDNGGSLSGSFQFDLTGAGTMQLSSQHRVDTGNVINMVEITQGTWTNLDADALAGGVDAIGGTLVVNTWDPAAGVADIEFQGVSLLNVVDGTVCTIDGSVVADEIYP